MSSLACDQFAGSCAISSVSICPIDRLSNSRSHGPDRRAYFRSGSSRPVMIVMMMALLLFRLLGWPADRH